MWPATFDNRLHAWVNLRNRCRLLDTETALTAINQWWFNAPWVPYHLHWDDQATWPDPWQLLSDNIYCELARGLGILYTINLLDRADMADAELVLADDGTNLVLVAKEKYILNWDKDLNVNNRHTVKVTRRFKQTQVTR
jgi:hypothetical protein